jgi:hypothetical protein
MDRKADIAVPAHPGNQLANIGIRQRSLAFCYERVRGLPATAIQRTKSVLDWSKGSNNKIRVLQRRGYGYRDDKYLKLKIVAAFLPPLPRNANINPQVSA